GPLRPRTAPATALKGDPRAEVWIDGALFPVALLFADDYVVLTDSQQGAFPKLSDRLIARMQTGKTMVLRFDLLAHDSEQSPSLDAKAIVDLQAHNGHEAIAALRRCADGSRDRRLGADLRQSSRWHPAPP